MSDLDYLVAVRRYFTRKRLFIWRWTYRLRSARLRAWCYLHFGHDWRYFIDGYINRRCVRCDLVQYDLPDGRRNR